MKVIFISEGPNGCGLYRAEIPIRYLHTQGIEARLSHVNALPDELDWADVVVVQKQFERAFYNKLVDLKRRGKKIVYELDDDVFNLPPWNPAYAFFQRTRINISQYLQLAHAVTVTTPALKNIVSKHNRNVHITPNSLDFRELDEEGPAPEQISALDKHCAHLSLEQYRERIAGKFVIGWLGSPTHKRDLQQVIPALKYIVDHYPDRVVVVMGGCTDRMIIKNTPHANILLLEMVPPRVYLRYLAALGLTVGLAPVHDHLFNHSKSNLKVIEYMACGYVPVASDIVTYNTTIKNGINGFTAREPRDWVNKLETLIKNPSMVESVRGDATRFAREHYDIRKTVRRWADVYRSLE